jgi:hypothetical protein
MTATLAVAMGTNGAVGPTRKLRRKPRAVVTARAVGRGRVCITVGMGCGVPVLSLALSSIGGQLVARRATVSWAVARWCCAARCWPSA